MLPLLMVRQVSLVHEPQEFSLVITVDVIFLRQNRNSALN